MSKKENHKKVIAVIQARMGSKRLRGKVLKKILGKSLIEWMKYRLSFAKEIDDIVLATADTKENDILEEEARRIGLPCFRGSESDLISRYIGVAERFDADAVVRICGDCPLVDPKIVDKLVRIYRDNDGSADFICNNTPPTYPHGMDVEVIPTKTLKRFDKEVSNPLYREWLTMNIIEHRDAYVLINIENEKNLRNLRLTVDYTEDLELVEKIIKSLHKEGKAFHLEDILNLFDKEPGLKDINAKWASGTITEGVRRNTEFQDLKSKNNAKK